MCYSWSFIKQEEVKNELHHCATLRNEQWNGILLLHGSYDVHSTQANAKTLMHETE